MSQEENLNGLGGWLILVGIGVVISPIRILDDYYPIFSQIFTDGTWEILTTPGTKAYNPLWGPLLIGEIIYNSAMFLVSCYLIYLYFSKHYLFPKVYIFVLLIPVFFIPLEAWMTTFILPDDPMFDPDTIKRFAQTLIGGLIWVPYLLISKRVKATFVEKLPDQSKYPEAASGVCV